MKVQDWHRRARDLFRAGYSVKEIAELVGQWPGVVSKAIRVLRIQIEMESGPVRHGKGNSMRGRETMSDVKSGGRYSLQAAFSDRSARFNDLKSWGVFDE